MAIANYNAKTQIIGIPLIIIFSLFLITRSDAFLLSPIRLSNLITFDFLITVPVVYYLLIRKSDIPKYTVATVFMLCMITASYVLPIDYQSTLDSIKSIAIPVIELLVLGTIIHKTRAAIRSFELLEGGHFDFYDALVQSTASTFPKNIAALISTEIGVIYYTFLLRPKEPVNNQFTYHKTSSIAPILYSLMMLIVVETVVVHMLIHEWNETVAWVLSAFSIYMCIQTFALVRSTGFRPHVLDEQAGKLYLRFGFSTQATIDLSTIEKIDLTGRAIPEESTIANISPLGPLGSHNLIIHLNEQHELSGLYGKRTIFNSIALHVDDKESLHAKISLYTK